MSRLLIIYHSRTGGAKAMAQTAFEAAKSECDTELLRAKDANPEDLLPLIWFKASDFQSEPL